LRSICGTKNSSQQTVIVVFVNSQHGIQDDADEDKILINSLYLKGYTAKRLTDEFPEKS